jgi:ribonuclease HI
VSGEKKPHSFSFLQEEKEKFPPSAEDVLRHLAQTLSVAKTFKRFPALTPKDLQEIFLQSAQRAKESRIVPAAESPRENFQEFFIYADGASRGNPGEAGAGAVICDARGRTMKELKSWLGMTSNNVAEYRALLLAVEKALELGARRITVFLDSELVVRQLRGEYRVREPHLKILHQKVLEVLNRLSQYSILYIPREENRRADQLANEAIDQKIQG